ncbi:MAG: response regulator transcription factor [Chloroflexi bacterium]|nr:response regulator transcription factor [Chloroflexota bacterium]
MKLIETVSDTPKALGRADVCDVILVSADFAVADVWALTHQHKASDVPVIVTDIPDDPTQIVSFLEAGAVGYLDENDPPEKIIETIQLAHRRLLIVSPQVGALLVERMRQLLTLYRQKQLEANISDDSDAQLTERESAVLALIGQGLSNHEIAQRLTIEPGTVKNHVHNILRKLNITSRSQAARYYALKTSSEFANN